jgi:dTDP-glucose 4,6-dehydratase
MNVVVTGGAGFLGGHLVRSLTEQQPESIDHVVVVDSLTYAGSRERLSGIREDRLQVVELDIRREEALADLFKEEDVEAVFHLAAESHVDRSIAGPADFVGTNVFGTYALLEAVRRRWERLRGPARDNFRLVHVSTDEVFGELSSAGQAFSAESPARPNSPYAATKASADMLVRAWARTYNVPVVTAHPCNVYGPWQHPEKFIPRMILSALEGGRLPVYGEGRQRREWLYAADLCEGLLAVWRRGEPGQRYLLGGTGDIANIDVARAVLERVLRFAGERSRAASIEFLADRPGHDARYALDGTGARDQLGWTPKTGWEEGLDHTVRWYLNHEDWARGMEQRATSRKNAAAQLEEEI